MKLKKHDVSSEVLVTAIGVKCNFTPQIDTNQGKVLNTVTEHLEGDWQLEILKAFLSKLDVRPHPKISGFSKREKIIMHRNI